MININSPGGTVSIYGSTWTNHGTINLTAGALSLTGAAHTADLGTIHNTGGSVNFQGLQLDNSNATLSLDGGWNAYSGGIHHGTILSNGGSLFINATSFPFDGVTLAGDFSNSTFTNAVFSNGTTLSNATLKFSSFERFDGNQTLSGVG